MSTHHMGNLLKRSAIATFNHKQSYTTRNIIDNAYGRIGKHVSPVAKARVIALDSEFGIPYIRNTELKAEQLKVYQENFNVTKPKSETQETPAWKVIQHLNRSNEKFKNSKINLNRISEPQFKDLKKIVESFGNEDSFRRSATLSKIKEIVALDSEYETPVQLPILKPTTDNETYVRLVGNPSTHHVSAGFVIDVVNKQTYTPGKTIKAKVVGVNATSKGFVPVLEIEGKTMDKMLAKNNRNKKNKKIDPNLDLEDGTEKYFEAGGFASKFGLKKK